MKIILTILFSLSILKGYAQGSYYHDPTLDTINSGVWANINTNPLTADQITKAQNTNASRFLTNFGSFSNLPYLSNPSQNVNIDGSTNQDALTNLMGNLMTNTIGTNFTPQFGLMDTNHDAQAVDDSASDIYISSELPNGQFLNNGDDYTMAFTYSASGLLPFWLPPVVRGILMTVFWSVVFMWLVEDLNEYINETMNQPQTEGSKEEVVGTNLSAVTGFAYAVVFTIFLATAIGIVLSNASFVALKSLGSLPVLQNKLVDFIGIDGISRQWSLLTQFLPVFQMLSAFVFYKFVSSLGMRAAFYVVRAIRVFMLD